MLHIFCNGFFKRFSGVFQTYIASVSTIFERILQLFYLDVSKVHRVLHLSSRLLLPRLDVFSSFWMLVIFRQRGGAGSVGGARVVQVTWNPSGTGSSGDVGPCGASDMVGSESFEWRGT
jgi:hypothetical protein